jgi:hypothetical protein
MLLITSGNYVSDELASEFGRIPPAFVPVGNKRLIYWQLEHATVDEDIFLSIPSDYHPNNLELQKLASLNVTIIKIPSNLSLGESVVYALNTIGIYDQELLLLHGDTIVKDIRKGDSVCLGETKSAYQWEPEGSQVWAGYFSFSHTRDLIKAIVLNGYNFVEGIRNYTEIHDTDFYSDPNWLDFGHINTYYQSKSFVTTERAFNSLEIKADIVTKKSDNKLKLNAEKNWYESLPVELKVYTPQLLEVFDTGYKIEYQYMPSLSEIFVFGELSTAVWDDIIAKAFSVLMLFRQHKKPGSEKKYIEGMFEQKTLTRLNTFSEQTGISVTKKYSLNGLAPVSLSEVYQLTLASISKFQTSNELSLIHGDMCFSNILYDFRRGNLKLIDPRGLSSTQEIDIFGSFIYDLAKLFHSITGYYDWIIAGYYNLEINNDKILFQFDAEKRLQDISDVAAEQLQQKFSIELQELLPFIIHLFLSMLPLHADDRQRQLALMSNAIRLFTIWSKK